MELLSLARVHDAFPVSHAEGGSCSGHNVAVRKRHGTHRDLGKDIAKRSLRLVLAINIRYVQKLVPKRLRAHREEVTSLHCGLCDIFKGRL